MQAIKVLTWVPGEPRRAVPHAVVEAIIDMVEARYLHDFFAVQMVFLILVLYYSFSRTCLLYTSPSPRDGLLSRMPSSA